MVQIFLNKLCDAFISYLYEKILFWNQVTLNMQITRNTIFQSTVNSDKIIQYLINHYKKVIFVIDNKNETTYDNIFNSRNLDIYSTVVKERLLLSRHRFFFLVRYGLLSSRDCDCIIFKLKKLETLEISTFIFFYFKYIHTKNIFAVFAFLEKISEMDCVYLHSKIFYLTVSSQVEQDINTRIIFSRSKKDENLTIYLKLKKKKCLITVNIKN